MNALTTERLTPIDLREYDGSITIRKPGKESHGIFVYTEQDSKPISNYCSICDQPYYGITDLKSATIISLCMKLRKCPHSSNVKGCIDFVI